MSGFFAFLRYNDCLDKEMNEMNVELNAVNHGFQIKEVMTLPYLEATYYLMEHQKTKAKLVYLDREDLNKTFAICVKTIPSDDTGVFHILEHSVLGGSRKYPVKEPFVELLKSSMNTFLNAMTFPDKTMYPVSSQNEKDFMNLVEVYLDAVYDPAIYFNKNIFLQEGWHYEMDEETKQATYRGVVYNEMKGVYSGADAYLDLGMSRLLYSDTCYQYESGGDPKSIPNLSYERFLETHQAFYAMSNSYFFVDGSVDIDAVLALVDSYASKQSYVSCDHEIKTQEPKQGLYGEVVYPIEEDASLEDATMINFGKIVSTFADLEKNYAYKILCNYLAGNNDSCLKKALLESGLAKDVYLDLYDGIKQPYINLSVRHTSQDQLPQIKHVVVQVLEKVLEEGLDYEMIEASLSYLEFKVKERGNSNYPEGVLLSMSVMESWLYGGDPTLCLDLDGVFKHLRQWLHQGYFEDLIKQFLSELQDVAVLVAKPSKTLALELEKEEAERLERVQATWDEKTIHHYLEENKALLAFQTSTDSKEALDCMPKLTLDDIDLDIEAYPYDFAEVQGVPIRHYHLKQQGIVYLHLFFKLQDMSPEELSALGMMCQMYTELPTEHYRVQQLSKKMKATFGAFSTDVLGFNPQAKLDHCQLYFVVKCSFLEENERKAYDLLQEILYRTKFNQQEFVLELIKQNENYMKETIMNNGHRYGMMRAQASQTQKGYIAEMSGGYAFYEWLKQAKDGYDFTELSAKLKAQLNRSNLELSYHGIIDETLMVQTIPEGSKNCHFTHYELPSMKHETIPFPMQVGYACLAGNLYCFNQVYHSSLKVLSKIVSLEYLWNEIRVRNGAYGTGMTVGMLGEVGFYSYRDPSPQASLDLMRQTCRFINDFNKPLDRYIIATIADETVLSTSVKLNLADAYYFIGMSDEARREMRQAMVHTTLEDLRTLCEALNPLIQETASCIIGKSETV